MISALALTFIGINDTSFSGLSGSPKPIQSTTVRMMTADIRIQVPEGKVKVTYVFQNESNKTVNVQMGFPEEGQDAYLDDQTKSHFKYFKSTVDGKAINTSTVISEKAYEDWGYKIWWVKTVTFKPNQARTIVNEYQSEYGGNSLPSHFFDYIVETAKTWKGPIKWLRAEIDVKGLDVGTKYGVKPVGSRKEGTKHLWYWTNFEPTENNNLSLIWQTKEMPFEVTEELTKYVFGGKVYTR